MHSAFPVEISPGLSEEEQKYWKVDWRRLLESPAVVAENLDSGTLCHLGAAFGVFLAFVDRKFEKDAIDRAENIEGTRLTS